MTIAEMRAQRQELLDRPRRIIFNNDGCDVLYEMTAGTKEALLAARSTALPGTQVDTVFYTPACSGFGQFTYATDIGDRLTCAAPSKCATSGYWGRRSSPLLQVYSRGAGCGSPPAKYPPTPPGLLPRAPRTAVRQPHQGHGQPSAPAWTYSLTMMATWSLGILTSKTLAPPSGTAVTSEPDVRLPSPS